MSFLRWLFGSSPAPKRGTFPHPVLGPIEYDPVNEAWVARPPVGSGSVELYIEGDDAPDAWLLDKAQEAVVNWEEFERNAVHCIQSGTPPLAGARVSEVHYTGRDADYFAMVYFLPEVRNLTFRCNLGVKGFSSPGFDS